MALYLAYIVGFYLEILTCFLAYFLVSIRPLEKLNKQIASAPEKFTLQSIESNFLSHKHHVALSSSHGLDSAPISLPLSGQNWSNHQPLMLSLTPGNTSHLRKVPLASRQPSLFQNWKPLNWKRLSIPTPNTWLKHIFWQKFYLAKRIWQSWIFLAF